MQDLALVELLGVDFHVVASLLFFSQFHMSLGVLLKAKVFESKEDERDFLFKLHLGELLDDVIVSAVVLDAFQGEIVPGDEESVLVLALLDVEELLPDAGELLLALPLLFVFG